MFTPWFEVWEYTTQSNVSSKGITRVRFRQNIAIVFSFMYSPLMLKIWCRKCIHYRSNIYSDLVLRRYTRSIIAGIDLISMLYWYNITCGDQTEYYKSYIIINSYCTNLYLHYNIIIAIILFTTNYVYLIEARLQVKYLSHPYMTR